MNTTLPPMPPPVLPSHLEELGHQKANPIVQQFTKSFGKGFLAGLIINRVFGPEPVMERRKACIGIAFAFAGDAFVSEFAKELSYEHEYAREVWEHEFNSMGEIDEYVSYGLSRGLTAERAKEIASIITSEPSVSVPYHLAFELGLLEPGSYRHKLKHSVLVGLGFAAGSMASEASCVLCDYIVKSSVGAKIPLSVAVCCIGLTPVLGLRYKHISRVAGAQTFKIAAFLTFASIILVGLNIGRISR